MFYTHNAKKTEINFILTYSNNEISLDLQINDKDK